MLPDGSINPGSMTSFNHYALGSVAHFLHAIVGGLSPSVNPLDPASPPGWKQALIRPQPGGTITHADTSYSSPYGTFSCSWSIAGCKLKVDATIPPNTSALVVLPGRVEEHVGSGVYTWEVDWCPDERWPPRALKPASQSRPVDRYL